MAEAAGATAPVAFAVLRYVRTAQAHYGLKHADYTRYRHHCSSRLTKLRCSLNFKQGRNKYVGKVMDINAISDARWLELILLEAERAWAMAQELKSEMAKAGEEHAGKRRHMLRRFAKARRYATDLQAAADAAADVRTRLEACAYCDYISALELFEKDRDTGEAAGRCERVRDDATTLAAGGVPDDRAAARAHAQQAEALFRLVAHRLEREGGDAAQLEAHADLREQVAARASADAGAAAEASADGEGFKWLGESFEVENSAAQAKLDAAVAKLHEARAHTGGGAAPAQERIGALQAALSPFDAAIESLAGALASLQEAGEPAGPREQALRSAIAAALEETRIERYAVHALQVALKFRVNAANEFAKSKARERGARPEDALRLFDGLHRAALSLEAAAGAPGLPAALVQTVVATSAASASLFAAGRRTFVGHLRLARGERPMAHAMFHAAGGELEEARGAADGLGGAWVDGGVQRELCELLERDATAWGAVAAAEAAAADDTSEGALSRGVKDLRIKPGAKRGRSGHDDDWDALRRYEPLGTVSGKNCTLFRLESLLQLAPMRPITLDTAAQFITPPDLSHRLSEAARKRQGTEPASLVQGFKSLFKFGGS